MIEDQLPAPVVVDGRGVLQHHAQVVGKLAVVRHDARLQVGLLESEERQSTFAGVAVGEVGQEEVVPATGVERLDVVRLQLGQRHSGEVFGGRAQWCSDSVREFVRRQSDQVQPVHEVLVGVAEQEGCRLPSHRQLLLAESAVRGG